MRVIIKSDRARFAIVLPTALFLNRLSSAIATKIIKSKQPLLDISIDDFMKILKVIKTYKKKYKRMEIINIHTANGDVVYLSL